MCKFCEGLFDKEYEMEWCMRTSYADDNLCEKIFNDSCEKCNECNISYRLTGRRLKERKTNYINCSYKFTNGDITMWNSTEPLTINYCPYCGKQISENLVDLDDIGNHIVDIIDKNGDSWDYESYKLNKEFGLE